MQKKRVSFWALPKNRAGWRKVSWCERIRNGSGPERIIRSGELGELRAIQSLFSYYNADPGNIRNMADIGGGALLDIGCYPMVAARYFLRG
ncbi:hypothetical protein [uncultured Roseibium sp.]|uniref:Gfo/Idh/MocA family protein n=1 Tax=uncultured Roseibium sp. TaxID=1936171 RepID=UPI0032177A0A